MVYRKKRGVVYFLLLKHTSGNHWSLAKGHAEAGESETETALREIREETGLKVRLKPNFRAEVRYSPHEGIDKRVVFFLAKTDRKKLKLQASEISNSCWLELDDALKLISHADTGEVLRQASARLNR
ncbi:MAG: NUDIX domain-containing protein [Spirochaetales bacterium]